MDSRYFLQVCETPSLLRHGKISTAVDLLFPLPELLAGIYSDQQLPPRKRDSKITPMTSLENTLQQVAFLYVSFAWCCKFVYCVCNLINIDLTQNGEDIKGMLEMELLVRK